MANKQIGLLSTKPGRKATSREGSHSQEGHKDGNLRRQNTNEGEVHKRWGHQSLHDQSPGRMEGRINSKGRASEKLR